MRTVAEGDSFDERIAAGYDDHNLGPTRQEFAAEDIDATAEFLANLAGDGPALEFGVGTGRIALPLARRGLRTQGIDLSRPMVARLKAKPGGKDVDVAIGDMGTTSVAAAFPLGVPGCNTIMN